MVMKLVDYKFFYPIFDSIGQFDLSRAKEKWYDSS